MLNASRCASFLNQRGIALAELLVAVILAATLMFIAYQIIATRPDPTLDELKKENRFLREELDLLSERHADNQARLAVLERETEVVRGANRLLREEEADRQAEIAQLEAQLDFYSRLAGTGGEQTGLAVYQVELSTTESPRVFRFMLTLTQNIRRASIVSGKASLDLEGTLADRPVTLYWPQLNEGVASDRTFRFKYFQQLEGYLTLPESFSPTRLVVSLEVKGEPKPVTRAFDWQDMLADTAREGSH
jgi:hypothetical protein